MPRRTIIAARSLAASRAQQEAAFSASTRRSHSRNDYADAYYNLGSSLRVLGRYDEALASLNRALALQPNRVKALNNRGAVMEALNRLAEALARYNQALAIAPDFAELGIIAAACLIGLDRADEAIENFTSR